VLPSLHLRKPDNTATACQRADVLTINRRQTGPFAEKLVRIEDLRRNIGGMLLASVAIQTSRSPPPDSTGIISSFHGEHSVLLMKIVLTNHALDYYGGSETFTYALACELQRLGHDIICFSPRVGTLAEHLSRQGIRVTSDLRLAPDGVDVIHAHHRYESLLTFARYPCTPMVLVCHGILPWQEQPLRSRLNIHRYVAVSEEVREHLVHHHRIPDGQVVIIRNGIDLDRFASRSLIAPQPRRALVVSNYMLDAMRAQIRRVCGRLGITVNEVGRHRPIWHVEDDINQADIVFALGRSALEAMACKRAVIVYDYNGGDGLVTPQRFSLLRQRNFSGRTHGHHYTDDELAREIIAYDPAIPEELHAIIEQDHDARRMARQFLALYGEALAQVRPGDRALRETSLRQYTALTELLGEMAALRAAAASQALELQTIQRSRSWRAVTAYHGIKGAISAKRRRPREEQRPRRILVIDDDELVSQWLADVLTTEGHEVDIADNGRAALDLLEARGYDVILSDLRMPDLDGVALYQEVTRRWPDLSRRVIILTGNAEVPEYQRFLAGLGGRSVAKPIDLADLSRLIQQTLEMVD